MDSFILAASVVFPIFALIVLGYVLRRIKMVDAHSLDVINKLVFKVFLPVLLFYNIYKTDVSTVFDGPFLLYALLCILVVAGLLFLLVPLFIKENSRRGVFIQGVFRSNFVLFGLPVTVLLLGENGAGLTSIAIAMVVPVFNILAVVCLEVFRGGKPNLWKVVKGILTNPLIIASALGILFLLLNIRIPSFVEGVVRDLSRVATPLALVALGGSFTFSAVKGNVPTLTWAVALRLVIVPALAIGVGALFGFRGAQIVALLSMFASPTAVSSYTMAQQMGGDGDLAAQIVVFTSACSILTMFLFIFTLKSLALI